MLVENYRPTVMPRAGLGFEALREVNPRLIYAQLSGLGYDGPYAGRGGFDLIAQGMGGIMHVTGEADGPPTSVGLPICDLGTGMWAVQGILAALYERQRTGRAARRMLAAGDRDRLQLVDQRAMAGRPPGADPRRLAPSPERALSAHADAGRLSDDRRRRPGDLGALRRRARRTRNGARTRALRPTRRGCRTAPRSKPRWKRCSRPARPSIGSGCWRRPACRAARSTITRRCSPTRRSRHRGMVQYASDPELGEVPHIRTPIKIGDSVRVRTVAPKLGQHNAEIFGRLGLDTADIAALKAKGVL